MSLNSVEQYTALVENSACVCLASATDKQRNWAFAPPNAYEALIACISYKATSVSSSKEALKVFFSVLACVLIPFHLFFFFFSTFILSELPLALLVPR